MSRRARRRIAAAVTTTALLASSGPALAESQRGFTEDDTVITEAEDDIVTPARPGKTRQAIGRARVSARALYLVLRLEMLTARQREARIRSAESQLARRLESIRRTCVNQAARWARYDDPFAAPLARAFRACARIYARALARHIARIRSRRAAWDARWASLNQRAHTAWRRFNTTCRTVGRDGSRAVQRCTYPRWRNYSAGSFVRRVKFKSPTPARSVVRRARDQVTPQPPIIRMNPSVRHEQIVHLPSWLWIEGAAWNSHTARAAAGRAWAEATATPARVVWDMGNGDRVVCRGPGTPYDRRRPESAQRSNCTYTYQQSSAGRPNNTYTVTATVVYDVTWRGSNDSGGDLGPIRTSSSVRVRVAEIQALNT